ncbi:hypothetical protein [Methanolobus sp. ZRKC5]|uniref:hypothetical protein n=1 Tax=unclassified Methanolobus TaxID=2629569 RepID=UPI00313C24E2
MQLSRTIFEYANHLGSKFDGDIGVLERKHVHADSIVYIGKEANNIDEQELNVEQAQEFINKDQEMQRILNITVSEAKDMGVPKTTLWDMQKRINDTGNLNLNTLAVMKWIWQI